jgi:hypothetical protein
MGKQSCMSALSSLQHLQQLSYSESGAEHVGVLGTCVLAIDGRDTHSHPGCGPKYWVNSGLTVRGV